MSNDTNPIFDALDALLEEERTALMQGDLDRIGDLIARKEALFDLLAEIDPQDAPDVSGLRAKTLRNQAMLDAALQGIRAVAERMRSLRRVRDALETYDSQGRRTAIPAPAVRQVEKRA